MFFCIKTTMSGKKPSDDNRAMHQRFLKARETRLHAAGPTFNEGEEKPEGSIFLVEADDFSDAKAFIKSAPFFQEGIRGQIDIFAWSPGGYARKFPIESADL